MKDVRAVPFAATGGPARTYKKNVIPVVIVCAAAFLVLAAIFSSRGRFAIIPFAVAGIFIFVPLGLEFRRSIVVSPDGFEYKWRSGRVVKIAWADVERIEETTTPYMVFPLRPIPVPGVDVFLRSGAKLTFPLDFPKRTRQEVVKRMLGAVSSMEGRDLPPMVPTPASIMPATPATESDSPEV